MIAIVPTACGIETTIGFAPLMSIPTEIAIVPTACGIETLKHSDNKIIDYMNCNSTYRLRY